MQNIREHLFLNYMNELYNIEGLQLLSKQKIKNVFYGIINNQHLKWIDIFPDSHKTNHSGYTVPIGFLVIGEFPECHPDTNYYIAEAYIKPNYRKQHIMSEVVLDYIKTYGGKYSLFIASKNDAAKQFWNDVFEKAEYMPIELSKEPIAKPNPHFIQYGWQPKNKML